jgi:polar amino acid transport system substrate-binding protein
MARAAGRFWPAQRGSKGSNGRDVDPSPEAEDAPVAASPAWVRNALSNDDLSSNGAKAYDPHRSVVGGLGMIRDFMQAVSRDLAPEGTLRAVLNFSNPIVVKHDGVSGEPGGLAVEIVDELARRLAVPRVLFGLDGAAGIEECLAGGWDVAFLSIELARAQHLDWTAPYLVLESTYLVRDDSPFRTVLDLDREGVRIAAGQGGFYDLYLTRTLKHAQVFRAPTFRDAVERFLSDGLDAVAGLRQPLMAVAQSNVGQHVIEGRFAAVEQAIAVHKGCSAGLRYLNAFLEQMKANGRIAAAMRQSCDITPRMTRNRG